MIDIQKLSALQKKSSRSFHQQKTLIKKLMAGQQVLCQCCQQPLQLHLPKGSNEAESSTICCPKGCTDILLDFS
jgi:hypothetical protein